MLAGGEGGHDHFVVEGDSDGYGDNVKVGLLNHLSEVVEIARDTVVIGGGFSAFGLTGAEGSDVEFREVQEGGEVGASGPTDVGIGSNDADFYLFLRHGRCDWVPLCGVGFFCCRSRRWLRRRDSSSRGLLRMTCWSQGGRGYRGLADAASALEHGPYVSEGLHVVHGVAVDQNQVSELANFHGANLVQGAR